MVHVEAGDERLGRSVDQLLEGLLVPVGVAPLRGLLPHQLLLLAGVGGHLGVGPQVLDPVHRRLHPDVALVIEALPAGPPGDLGELPVAQQPRRDAVVLAELREQHGADGHVHPHAEGVGTAYQLQQALLGQLLDEQAVAGEHPGMVQADAVADEALQVLPDGGVEPEATHLLAYRRLLLPGEHVDAAEVLGLLGCRLLGEVDYVDRRPIGVDELDDRLVERRLPILAGQRNRPDAARHGDGGTPGPACQVFGEAGRGSERGRHEQELRVRQLQERNLPGPTTLRIAVEVELVGHHQPERAVGALPEGLVGEDLGRGADDRRVLVHRGIAGDHAHVLGSEVPGQGEELLANQGLDRGGVDAPLAPGQRRCMRCGGHQRLT